MGTAWVADEERYVAPVPGRAGATARWHVVHARRGDEMRAEQNLAVDGIEPFLPRVRAAGKASKPLFPGYLFASFAAERHLSRVRYTRGVSTIVNIGGAPAVVDDEVIRILKSKIGDDGLVRIGAPLARGTAVVVQEGPLRSLIGVVERDMPDNDRVIILLSALHYQARVCLPVTHVAAAANA